MYPTCVHPSAFVQLTDDINTCFLIPTFRDTFFFNKDQDGSSLKEALLSGSPGVGKTTTATLVCEELGFTYIEMNASDTRSKKTLEEHISQSLNNKTMDGFLTGCQISVRFGMTLILLKMLHSFSCRT